VNGIYDCVRGISAIDALYERERLNAFHILAQLIPAAPACRWRGVRLPD